MQKYKNFFIKTLIIFLAAIIIIPAVLIKWVDYMVGRHVYSQTAAYVNYLISQKNQKAQEFDKIGNKILIFSGSNTLYGVNTKYIHQKTGLPVVNYGIHAGLEDYIFEEAKKIMKSGDTVIMPLEYSLYKERNSTIPSQLAEYLVVYGRDYLNDVTLIQKLGLSFYLAKLIITYHKLDAAPIDEKTLTQTNEFGDFITNEGCLQNIKEDKKFIVVSQNIPQKYDNFPLYDFITFCKKNNVRLIATTPFNYHKEQFSQKEYEAFNIIKNFYLQNGVEFFGNIDSSSVFDSKYVYDYGYHANAEGQKLRSDKFIQIIKSLGY
ncbi:MAG: hypothetical protein ACI37T_08750 [Candidatus Gastranaerophilaceae bacterium]